MSEIRHRYLARFRMLIVLASGGCEVVVVRQDRSDSQKSGDKKRGLVREMDSLGASLRREG